MPSNRGDDIAFTSFVNVREPSEVSTISAERVVSPLLLGSEKESLAWLGRIDEVTEVEQTKTACAP